MDRSEQAPVGLPPGGDRNDGELLRTVFDALPVAVTARDQHGDVLLLNRAATLEDAAPPVDAAAGAAGATALVDRNRRRFLEVQRAARIGDRTLSISTSLDVTALPRLERERPRGDTDDLTGLANEPALLRRVEAALRRSGEHGRFALAFIDFDNFKHINDYYSRAAGDELLVKAAQRLTARVRRSDLLARIGGDRFVLLIDPVESEAELQAIVDRLSEDLKRPFYVHGFEVFTSASLGISICPAHGRTYDELRRSGGTAMHRIKRAGKGGISFYDSDIGEVAAARMRLEQRLRLAIRDRRFRCAFQPKVDFRSERVVGLEALVRWCDEDGAISPPTGFIGLAVELGLIDPITRLMLAQSIAALDRVNDAFGPDTTISINVAAKQAGDAAFMRTLADELRASGSPHRFMIELTEDAFVHKGLFQSAILPMLREIGVKVSVDDFGTGYSSLSALAEITVDEVKVDRSFITAIHRRPRSQSVLRAVESLSHALGMSVVAEGVETFEELAYLHAATRIRQAQGYYFSRPFFIDEIGHAGSAACQARHAEAARGRPEGRARAASRGTGGARASS